MATVDNFELIRPLLVFPKDNTKKEFIYDIQIMQRLKDAPSIMMSAHRKHSSSARVIQHFYVTSLEDFDFKKDIMIKLAKLFEARIYINLNIKNYRDVYAILMCEMAERMRTDEFGGLHRIITSSIGKTGVAKGFAKRWIVDIDDISAGSKELDEILNYLKTIKSNTSSGNVEVEAIIPTKNGVHIVTKPFDRNEFSKMYPAINIHKNNPTVLYVP